MDANPGSRVESFFAQPRQHFDGDGAFPRKTGPGGIEVIAGSGTPPTGEAAIDLVINSSLNANDSSLAHKVIRTNPNADYGQGQKTGIRAKQISMSLRQRSKGAGFKGRRANKPRGADCHRRAVKRPRRGRGVTPVDGVAHRAS